MKEDRDLTAVMEELSDNLEETASITRDLSENMEEIANLLESL